MSRRSNVAIYQRREVPTSLYTNVAMFGQQKLKSKSSPMSQHSHDSCSGIIKTWEIQFFKDRATCGRGAEHKAGVTQEIVKLVSLYFSS